MADNEPSFLEKHITGLPSIRKLILVIISEFVGTALLEFFGCLTVLKGGNLLSISIGWGVVVGHIVQVFGPLSGAHINPCVSLANIVLGKMTVALALIYMIFQFSGAIVGFVLLKGLLSQTWFNASSVMTEQGNAGMCSTFPNGVTPLQATFFEFIATAFLVLIVCSANDPRNRFFKDSFPLKVGAVIIADVLCIGNLTGCSVNTARTFATSLINNYWYAHWVYWVGPLLAGFLTPIFYMLSFDFKTGQEKENPEKTQAANEIMAKIRE